MDYIIVTTTCKDVHESEDIAKGLLKAKLAACVQINPIKSLYLWEGKVNDDSEMRVVIKTKIIHFESIKELITTMHSYDLPQIVFTTMSGSKEYLEWIDEALV